MNSSSAAAQRHSPAVICVAPNGARRGKADHPRIPLTAEELAADAVLCSRAGATVLHLHVRDEAGNHSLDPGRHRETLAAIRQSVGDRMILQVTTVAANVYQPPQQMAVVCELVPEAASIAVRELIAAAAAESETRHLPPQLLELRTVKSQPAARTHTCVARPPVCH